MSLTTKCLVTGGAGFIGSNLADELLKQGAKVTIIDNLVTGFRENLEEIQGDFDFIEGDLNDNAALKKALDGVETVFHQAALPSVPRSVEDPEETHQACVNATFNLLLKSKESGVKRFVYAASSSAYGNQKELPKVETMRAEPLSPYAAAKLMGEHYCSVFHEVYGLETISLRYFNVFGPKQSPNGAYAAVIPLFMQALKDHKSPTIHGHGNQTRDFTFVANAVQANVKSFFASKEAANQVFNVACGERISVNNLWQMLKQAAGSNLEPVYGNKRQGDVKDSLASISKAQRLLNYQPEVSVKEGLQLTWKFFNN